MNEVAEFASLVLGLLLMAAICLWAFFSVVRDLVGARDKEWRAYLAETQRSSSQATGQMKKEST